MTCDAVLGAAKIFKYNFISNEYFFVLVHTSFLEHGTLLKINATSNSV